MAFALPNLTYCLVAGLIGFGWGLSEIVGAFKNETGHALRTGGAWLLVLLNFVAASLIFLLVASLIPDANNWFTAIMVGLAWPTVIRNTTFKLAQPLQPEPIRDNATVRFEQAYEKVQTLARQLINNALTRQRMSLVTGATQHDLKTLEQFARLAQIASPLQEEVGLPGDSFIDRILKRQDEDAIKKAYLAAFILEHFGRHTLDDFLRQQRPKKTA
ncbi:MAG: hypothetical protein M3Q45_11200 [Chloroflexota bacterium]|nr:hypothetical protein [Chloroflexota bacterium]